MKNDRLPFPAATELLELLDDAAMVPEVPAVSLRALQEKVLQRRFNLAVVGEFKRGKSTLVNALLGAEVLPMGVLPLTSVVTLLGHSNEPGIEVEFESGEVRQAGIEDLASYVTEEGNPGNAKNVRQVTVGYPAAWLSEGIRLVDTPGLGSVHRHNTEATRRFLPEADAVIFVASVDQPLGKAELDFIVDIRRNEGRLFYVLNKIDHLSERELSESVSFVRSVLCDALGAPATVFPVSARLALRGATEGDESAVQRSGLPTFTSELRRFLTEEQSRTWVQSVRRRLARLLERTRLSVELELAGLSDPLNLLNARLAHLETGKRRSFQAQSEFRAVLEEAGRVFVKQQLEPDLAAFGETLSGQLVDALDAWHREFRSAGSRRLRAGLEEGSIAMVRQRFDQWRAQEESVVDDLCDRLRERVSRERTEIVDALMCSAAELFSVPLSRGDGEPIATHGPHFQYKFWEQTPSLFLITDALVRMLPRALGHPLILRRAQRRAIDLVEMQAGRMRSAFEARIRDSIALLFREMDLFLRAAVRDIDEAIDRGKALRDLDEVRLGARLEYLTACKARLLSILSRCEAAEPSPS
ncbi:dynamin family protein [Variovorax sp. Sphag1AA]|uniref:dynamin family protein n=1 Tax=Variovorax sp. Sphag1AA TaxID=2587027 RepID=UPI001613908A|nr:dynamin family protein [Variovorax sp. Sphag1AA]MBB3181205.1 GTP-binding protein EngB required for normal cell division [Variovorax sp. Sphag1AA]